MVCVRRSESSLTVESRAKGLRLTRQERLEVRRRVAAGESFEQAADAVRCTTKTVQRLINAVGGFETAGRLEESSQRLPQLCFEAGKPFLSFEIGKTFNVGTGLSDEERRNPPKIGSIITYSYTELTDDGIPKCAAFVAVRDYE